MSLARACVIAESKPNTWYLMLARQEHGTLADPNAEAYGPFKSEEKATEYLKNFANPGGVSVKEYAGRWHLSETEKRLIVKAERPNYEPNWL